MKTSKQDKSKNSKRKAVGYCRTSSENQRDNTSIPRQKTEIEEFIKRNKWQFIHHYVDESLSGAKVEGRDNFQRMMKDAAKEKFDFVVIYDIDRFARNGSDIISNCTFLKKTFGVHVIDTKGFDTRKPRNTLLNFVKAGVAEDDRLKILERTINGRIAKAKQGLPWSGKPPAGRAYNEDTKKWFVTEKGEKIPELLTRYVNGEALKPLAKEYGTHTQIITQNIRAGNLAGTYHAKFNSKDIGISEIVAVPQIPQVITPELEQRVKDYMAHNQTWNKNNKQKYVLASFVNCSHCGKPLKGQTVRGIVYYRHSSENKSSCPYRGIRGDLLKRHALNYLYNFFLDKPAYNKAIKDALPNDDDREALQKDIKRVNSQITKKENERTNIIKAIRLGQEQEEQEIDISTLLADQSNLTKEIQALESRRDELNETLVSLPDPERVKQDSMLLRIFLMEKHKGKDWQTMPYDDTHKFLHFLFSDNPRKTGYGIFVGKINGNWNISFKGCVEFHHDVIDGRPVSHALSIAAERESKELRRIYETGVEEAEREYEESLRESCNSNLRPNNANT